LQKLDGYRKVFNDIYPDLRTAKTEILTVKEKKTPAEISALSQKIVDGEVDADTLTAEEMAFAATLTPSVEEKRDIYKAMLENYEGPVAHNNLAAAHIALAERATSETQRNELVEGAITQAELANREKETAEGYINLANAYAMQGNTDKAYAMIEKAMAMSPSSETAQGAASVKGMLEIKKGDYDAAIASLERAPESDANSTNQVLAHLLNKDYEQAYGKVNSLETAKAHYLFAVTAARRDAGADVVANQLTKAFALDPSLKERAATDLEFEKYKSNQMVIDAMK